MNLNPTTHAERLELLVELATGAHDEVAGSVGMDGGPPLYRERMRLALERWMALGAEAWKIDLTQVPNVDAERVRADEAEQRASAAEERARRAEARVAELEALPRFPPPTTFLRIDGTETPIEAAVRTLAEEREP